MAPPLVELLYGKMWLPCVPYIRITCIGCTVAHLNTINLNLLMVKGRSDLFLRLETIKKTVSLAMLFYAATISVEAICWATVIYCHLVVILNAYYTGKILNITWWIQMKDCFPYIFHAVICCIPSYLITLTELPIFVQVFFGGTSSVLLYFGILHLLKEHTYAELYNTVKASRWGNKLLPFKPI